MKELMNINRLLMALTLLLAVSGASAADGMHVNAFNIEPGQTKTVGVTLDNATGYTGFQFQLSLPEGLDVVESASRTFTLTSRADASHSVTFRHLDDGDWRLVCFSSKNIAFGTGDGPLVEFVVRAASDFAGGELTLSDIHCSDLSNRDVAMPDAVLTVGTREANSVSMPAFDIYAGQTIDVGLSLDNESAFTAFQLDLVMPEGLSVVGDSFAVSSRGGSSHAVSCNDFGDGRVRVACFSSSNAPFSGNSGILLRFKVKASEDAFGTKDVKVTDIFFTRPDAREEVLADITVKATVSRASIESIELNPVSLSLKAGQSRKIGVKAVPEYAYTKTLTWSSSVPAVATVADDGTVTAVAPGETVITATADGSGVSASCAVTVTHADVESISVTPATVSLKVAEKTTLTAAALPATALQTVIWNSASPEIAVVSETGEVTAIALGTAKIYATATDGTGVKGESTVTVVATPAEGIAVSADGPTTLKAGQTVQLTATVTPATATDKTVTWKSGNENVAVVSEAGLVTAVSVGKATITATNSAGQTASVEITVEKTLVESIALNHGSLTLQTDETAVLTATVLPLTATDKSVKWMSGDEGIVTVSASGEVTPVAMGEAEITATAIDGSGVSASCRVTVVGIPVASVTLDKSALTLEAGESFTLNATVSPDNAADKSLTWNSSDVSVAVVSVDGSVTAVGRGTATVTARAASGVSAKCEVTVTQAVTSAIKIKGVYYRINTSDATAEAVHGDYSALETAEIVDDFTFAGVAYTVTSIGERAFYGCDKLKNVIVPASVTVVKNEAFYGCPALGNLEIADGDMSLKFGHYPFSSSYTIGRLYLGREYMFDSNYEPFFRLPIKEVVIGDNITSIPKDVFYGNTALSKLTLGKSLEIIPYRAFMDCSSLKDVVIPASVKEIEYGAFGGCPLVSVTSESSVPTTLDGNGFSSNTYSGATLNVPAGCRGAYASATSWKNFIHIVEDGESGIDTVISADNDTEVMICNLNGVVLYRGQYCDRPQLPRGVYVVTADGKSRKLIIK